MSIFRALHQFINVVVVFPLFSGIWWNGEATITPLAGVCHFFKMVAHIYIYRTYWVSNKNTENFERSFSFSISKPPRKEFLQDNFLASDSKCFNKIFVSKKRWGKISTVAKNKPSFQKIIFTLAHDSNSMGKISFL